MKALTVQNQATALNVAGLESVKFGWLATMAGKALTTQKTYAKVIKVLFDWLKENGVREVDNFVLTNFNNEMKSAGKSNATMALYWTVAKKFFRYVTSHAGIADFTALVEKPAHNETEQMHKRGALDETKAKKVMVSIEGDKKDISALTAAAAKIVAYECKLDSADCVKFNAGDYQRRHNRWYLKIWNNGKPSFIRLTSTANDAVTELYKTRFEILRDSLMVELMLKVGLRTVEVTRLTTDAVVTKSGKPCLMVTGKGRTAPEPVIITPALKRKIEEYLNYRADLPQKRNAAGKVAMFPSISKRNYGGFMDTSTVAKAAQAALEVVTTEEEKYSAHSLRHTAARLALKKTGYNVEKVRQMLRHRNIAVTSIYIRDIDFYENDATKQIELALG